MTAISTTSSPKVVKLDALKPDPRNARRRTERSAAMIERSLSHYGAARSIVVDEEGTVLAGNGTIEAAAAIGIDRVLVVPADGNTLVAVQRTDFTARQKKEYAIADNRSSDLSEFDAAVLADLCAEDPDLDISPFFTEGEFQALLEADGIETGNEDPLKDKTKPGGFMEVKLSFEREDDFEAFANALSDLQAALPKIRTTEERLQYVVDQFLSSRK